MSPSVDSSLAGVVVATTALASVDGMLGITLVRGYPLADLARRRSYEDVAHLVLEGELPDPRATAAFAAELAAGAHTARFAAPSARTPGIAEALVAALAMTGDSVPATTSAARLLGRVPDACAAAAGLAAPQPDLPYAARALRALGAKRVDADAERALEVLLVLESEHGLSASTFACRVAASSGASFPAALAAGAATLGGAKHGGATRNVHAFLHEAIASGDARGFADAWRTGPIPGFGHRVYKVPDPRAPPLKEALATLGDAPLLRAALEVEDAVTTRLGKKGVFANIDFFGAVLLDALGVAPDLFVNAFALGIACGWLAHAREQQATGKLVRPTSVYTGPPKREVPLAIGRRARPGPAR